jgi:hypothetical protein
MVRNPDLLRAFDDDQVRASPPDYFQSLKIFEALYEEARRLGALPPADPLEGIEVDLRIARALNV